MLFDRKQQLHHASDIIKTVIYGENVKNQELAIKIFYKKGRKTVDTGTLYFKGTKLYAVDVENYVVPAYTRVATSGLVRPGDLDRALTVSGGDPASSNFFAELLNQGSIPEKTIDAYTKEHYLEQLAIILSWQTCQGKMMLNASTKDFTLPMIEYKSVYDIIRGRQKQRREFIAEISSFFKDEEFFLLCPEKPDSAKINERFPNELKVILQLSDGTNTFIDIANKTGIGLDIVIQTIHKLWTNGILWLSYNALQLSYSSVKKSQVARKLGQPVDDSSDYAVIDINNHQDKKQAKAIEPEPVVTDESLGDTEVYNSEAKNATQDAVVDGNESSEPEETEEHDDDLIVVDDNVSTVDSHERIADDGKKVPETVETEEEHAQSASEATQNTKEEITAETSLDKQYELMESLSKRIESSEAADSEFNLSDFGNTSEMSTVEEYDDEDVYEIPQYSKDDMDRALGEFGKRAVIIDADELEEWEAKEKVRSDASDSKDADESVDEDSTVEDSTPNDAEQEVSGVVENVVDNEENFPTQEVTQEPTESVEASANDEMADDTPSAVVEPENAVESTEETPEEVLEDTEAFAEGENGENSIENEAVSDEVTEDASGDTVKDELEDRAPLEDSNAQTVEALEAEESESTDELEPVEIVEGSADEDQGVHIAFAGPHNATSVDDETINDSNPEEVSAEEVVAEETDTSKVETEAETEDESEVAPEVGSEDEEVLSSTESNNPDQVESASEAVVVENAYNVSTFNSEEISSMDMDEILAALNVSRNQLSELKLIVSEEVPDEKPVLDFQQSLAEEEEALRVQREKCMNVYNEYMALEAAYESNMKEFEARVQEFEAKSALLKQEQDRYQTNKENKATVESQIVELSKAMTNLFHN